MVIEHLEHSLSLDRFASVAARFQPQAEESGQTSAVITDSGDSAAGFRNFSTDSGTFRDLTGMTVRPDQLASLLAILGR